jgi:hypothetical protein
MEGEQKEIVNQPQEIGSLQKGEIEGEPKKTVKNQPTQGDNKPQIFFNVYFVKDSRLNT